MNTQISRPQRVDSTDLADAISVGTDNAGIADQHGAKLDGSQRSEIASEVIREFEARGYVVIEEAGR